MKKINLLTNLALFSTLAGSIAAISSCACKSSDIQITPELDHCSEDVNVKESNIVKYKESTITLTIGDNKEIESIVIICGNKQLVRGTDFKLDGTKITIYANVIDADNVTLVVTTKDKAKTTKESFLQKAAIFVEDTFTNSRLQYKNSDITFKLNGVTKPVISTDCHYESDRYGTTRSFIIIYGTEKDEDFEVGNTGWGGEFLQGLKLETVEGVTYEVTDEYISYKDTKAVPENYDIAELKINKYGYIEIYDQWADKASKNDEVTEMRVELTYNGAPTVNSKNINFKERTCSLTNVIRIECQAVEVVNENDMLIILDGNTTGATEFSKDVVIKLYNEAGTIIASTDYTTPSTGEMTLDIPFEMTAEQYNTLTETDKYYFQIELKA